MPQGVAEFLFLSLAVMATPGPAVAHVLASALLGGARLAGAAMAGLILGHCVTISLSLTAGAALMASPALLAAGQGAAAAVLLLLGLRLLRRGLDRAGAAAVGGAAPRWPESRIGVVAGGFVMTLGNPLSLSFAVSAAAGFLDPAHPHLPQSLVLGGAYIGAAAAVYATYAALAAMARGRVLGAVARRQGPMRLAAGLVMLAAAGIIGLRSARLLEASMP
ncbi:LysE family transporter [Roseicella frigidaeris]|uniref:LysE family translocator n=1 Tax=Roseicella frigidaeris TaxID=2230885 RepID=A0A327M5Y7_9PROT|nr:LysE family transporter [Roseicella frigidaeris]RAI57835.1 LysE family translocator [Roseicella frigidaeris]